MNILKNLQQAPDRETAAPPSRAEANQELYRSLNREIVEVCRDLPDCLQLPATLQLMAGGLRSPADDDRAGEPEDRSEFFDFCSEFPAPLWSILTPAALGSDDDDRSASVADRKAAVRTQAMAFLLHLIDDHLCDGQTPPDILVLQLRTAVWNRFEQGLQKLAPKAVNDGQAIREWVDAYFESTYQPTPPADLSEYMSLATRQMAIWTAAPALLALRAGAEFDVCRKIHEILEAVTLAWRLTDDIDDRLEDARLGHRSALYFLSPPYTRVKWEAAAANTSPAAGSRSESEAELDAALEAAKIPARARELANEYLATAHNAALSLAGSSTSIAGTGNDSTFAAEWTALARHIAATETRVKFSGSSKRDERS